jgi:menaquinone-dependent protoporphyrinogen IX oxidase
MKTLVVFYSRDGTTRKAATIISEVLKCDIEELVDMRKRSGFLGYMRAGFDATFRRLTMIEEPKKDPSSYELIVIGTPIWSSKMTPAFRTYLTKHKDQLKNVSLFCSTGSGSNGNTFAEMQNICNKKPVATLEIKTDEVPQRKHMDKIEKFIQEITNAT